MTVIEGKGMDPYIVCLHDANLHVFLGGEQVCQSPGFALMTSKGIEVGSAALNRARLNPRQVNHQFWHRLSTDRLPESTPFARHYADLAFLHLQHLSQYLQVPARVIFSVPSSYSSEQLSLLTGIARACEFQVVGLVDSAVAAASACELPADLTCVVDMQLQQTDIVTLSVRDGSICRQRVDSINPGLIDIHEKWMQLFADAFIDQCRFDPLHDAATEQALMLKLADWFTAIRNCEEVLLELTSSGQRVQARLQSAQAIEQVMPLYQNLKWTVDQTLPGTSHVNLLVSEEIASLPGLDKCLPIHQVIPDNAIATACNQHLDVVCKPGENSENQALAFVTALPVCAAMKTTLGNHPEQGIANHESMSASNAVAGNRASHVLHGHVAYSLDQPLFIGTDTIENNIPGGARHGETGSELQLGYSAQDFSCLYATIVNNAGVMELRVFNDASVLVNDEPVSGTRAIHVSDRITLEPCAITLRVIGEISNGSPA